MKKRLFAICLDSFISIGVGLSQTMLIHGESRIIPISVNSVDSITFPREDTSKDLNYYLDKVDSLEKCVLDLKCTVDSFKSATSSYSYEYTPPTYYNNSIRSIQRLGYGVPRQSLVSFKRAYEEGFRILLCDLVFTKDSIPICFHDTYIGENQTYVRYKDGSEVEMRPVESERVYIRDVTFEELNEKYDFGIYAGEQYAGTKVMRLSEALLLCKRLGVELYIEVKEMDEKQSKIACDIVQRYGMTGRVSWSGDNNMIYVVHNIPSARVSTMPKQITDDYIKELISFKTGLNSVFFFGWNQTILNEEIVDKLIENNIEFEMGTIDSEEGVINYMNQGDAYNYCTGIESNNVIAGKVLLGN